MLRPAVETWLLRCPLGGASREQAAAHEAGHFVASAVLDLEPGEAEIYGGRGVRHDWSGRAQFFRTLPQPQWGATGFELSENVLVSLCGPIAEELIAQGDAMRGGHCDLLDAALSLRRAAALKGGASVDAEEALDQALSAVALVEGRRDEIEAIAELLARRKRIHARDRSVARLLHRAQRVDPPSTELSSPGCDLARRLAVALVDLDELFGDLVL